MSRGSLVGLHLSQVSMKRRRLKLSTVLSLMLAGFLITILGLLIWANLFGHPSMIIKPVRMFLV